jgi:hypothetical protein
MLLDYYGERFGADAAAFLDPGVTYARIEPERMFTFYLDPGLASSQLS